MKDRGRVLSFYYYEVLEEKMGRIADYTIAEFLYQFNKTLHVILESKDDDKIVI